MPSVGFHGVRGSCPCSDPALSRYGGSTASVTVDAGDGTPPGLLDLGTGCRRLGESLRVCSVDLDGRELVVVR